MEKWLEALTSGEYQQTHSVMCEDVGEGEKAYCCIGVLNEVVLGTEWHKPEANYDYAYFCDDDGEVEMVARERVGRLDLDLTITEDELNYFADKGTAVTPATDRLSALAILNDNFWTFDDIADAIRELGWDE